MPLCSSAYAIRESTMAQATLMRTITAHRGKPSPSGGASRLVGVGIVVLSFDTGRFHEMGLFDAKAGP